MGAPPPPHPVPPLHDSQKRIEGLGSGYQWIGFTSTPPHKGKGPQLKSYKIRCAPGGHEYEVAEQLLLVGKDAACTPCKLKRSRDAIDTENNKRARTAAAAAAPRPKAKSQPRP